MRKILVRLSLVVFGLLLSAFAIEATLQLGALYIRSQGGKVGSWTNVGALGVLSLGDSNTYGLHLADRNQAYPTMLQQLWRKRFPQQSIEVINAGVPGTNSSKLRNQFPALLRTFQPDVVTIMIGANDFWTEPEPIRPLDVEQGEEPPTLWGYSRLYRLLYMLVRASQKPQVEIEFANPEGYRKNRGTVRYGDAAFDLGWTRQAGSQTVPEWRTILLENCKAITQQARAAGVIPIFITYAYQSDAYEAASDTVRQAAALTGAPLIDLKPAFPARCPEGKCPDLYYPSHHPTAKGHRLIAEALLLRLVDLAPDPNSG
jgi:lysophospholipase L1-like esterase